MLIVTKKSLAESNLVNVCRCGLTFGGEQNLECRNKRCSNKMNQYKFCGCVEKYSSKSNTDFEQINILNHCSFSHTLTPTRVKHLKKSLKSTCHMPKTRKSWHPPGLYILLMINQYYKSKKRILKLSCSRNGLFSDQGYY